VSISGVAWLAVLASFNGSGVAGRRAEPSVVLGARVSENERLAHHVGVSQLRLGGQSNSQVDCPVMSSTTDTVPRPRPQLDVSRFDSITGYALRDLIDSAAARGLPAGPLINLALEGSARRANSILILKVVRAHALAMSEARDLLGAESTSEELDTGASALRAGIEGQVLSSVRASRPRGGAVTPLLVLTDIVRRGVPSVAARDAVMTIARMPRSDDALLGLQATVAKNALRGPGMAVDALNRYVRTTIPGSGGSPATLDRKPIRPPSP